jgi:hypothetical protein
MRRCRTGTELKSIDGVVTSAPSSVTAKCWRFGLAIETELFWPRLASTAVTFVKMLAPLPLKPKLTAIPCVGSVVTCGLETSEPVSFTLSAST